MDVPLEVHQIQEILPHRYPMLLVDRVIEYDTDEDRIVGIKNVTINEEFFQGHYPGTPVMPGVLQIECMAQTGGIYLLVESGLKDAVPFFMSCDKVKFRKPVRPGDQLRVECQFTNIRKTSARLSGRMYVGDELVSQAELAFMLALGDS